VSAFFQSTHQSLVLTLSITLSLSLSFVCNVCLLDIIASDHVKQYSIRDATWKAQWNELYTPIVLESVSESDTESDLESVMECVIHTSLSVAFGWPSAAAAVVISCITP